MYVSTFEVLLTLKSPAERRLRKNSIKYPLITRTACLLIRFFETV